MSPGRETRRQIRIAFLQHGPAPVLFQDLAEELFADEDGEVSLPKRQTWVFASLGDKASREATISANIESHTIRLLPTRALVIRVVDTYGNPLDGIPVALVRKKENRPPRVIRRGRSVGGEVRFAQIELVRSRETLRARLDFPLSREVFELFDPSAWPKEPITLICPPTGEVEVLVRDGRGDPSPDGTWVQLGVDSPNRPWPPLGDCALGFTAAGSVIFKPVGLDLDLTAGSGLQWDQIDVWTKGRGPQAHGHRSNLTIDVEGRLRTLIGRLIYDDGEAASKTKIHFYIKAAGYGTSIKTDADGRFSMTVGDNGPGSKPWVLVARPSAQPDPDCIAEIPVDRESEGTCELGDVVLPRPVPLATGIVLDPDANPIVGAEVRFVAKNAQGRAASEWKQLYNGRQPAPTNSEGRFEIWGRAPAVGAWITVIPDGPWRHEPIPFVAGMRDVELVVSRAGALTGRLMLPSGIRWPRVALWPQAAGPRPSWARGGWLPLQVKEDGRISAGALVPGLYDLAVGFGIASNSVTYVEDIKVGSTETTRDPRLNPLDLGEHYRTIDLQVHNEQGESVLAFAVAFYEGGGRDQEQLGWTRRPLVIPRTPTLKTIVVMADGYIPQDLGPVEGTREVRLSRGHRVTLTWTGGQPLPSGVRSLEAQLESTMERPASTKAESYRRARSPSKGEFGEDGKLELRTAAPGTYRLRLAAWVDDHGYNYQEDVTPVSPIEVHVPAEGTSLSVEVANEFLEAAWSRLEMRAKNRR